jgi:uncharacterized NAD(P)/FAD-binding protein YdhS
VAVVGAGAAGTLTAVHLATEARRGDPLHLLLVDPAEPGRGVAYSTPDPRHLLNVPAGGLSAYPDQPEHFVAWLRREVWHRAGPADFAPRAEYGRYLAATLADAVAAAPDVELERVARRVVAVERADNGALLRYDDMTSAAVDAVVLATGIEAPGTAWAPDGLRSSRRFVADPWAPGALDVLDAHGGAEGSTDDVLLVGTGLTMVDLAATLARTGRVLHAVSRRGRVPAAHTTRCHDSRPTPTIDALRDSLTAAAASPEPPDRATLRRTVRDLVAAAVRERGDWRAALDVLRPVTGALWSRLCEDDRAELLRGDLAWWDLHRHRMPPLTAAATARMRAAGSLRVTADEVLAAEPTVDGRAVDVTLRSGQRLTVAAVVNCTGPQGDVRRSADPLTRDLLASGTATAGPLHLGLRTRAGRLVDATGSDATPLWTLGALRRGELWETTAIPEIRDQAAALAPTVLAAAKTPPSATLVRDTPVVSHPKVANGERGGRRNRPSDVMGLPLSTHREAATAFNRGLDAVMRVQSGAAEAFTEAVALDPDFALGHAALAMLGHEGGADAVDVRAQIDAATAAVRRQGTDRERGLVAVVESRVRDCRGTGARALLQHIDAHPRDVLAVSAAVPTIAFSGVTDVQQEAWALVEGLEPAYSGHWWHRSLLAFVRQDQARYDEAGTLAESVLALEPAAGHAVHARTHVYYETGDHVAGLRWLDPWITTCGRQASHRAHFSWHAALHELSTGDCDAVRKRYAEQLAPPSVTGVRGLVDSASLLWRCQVTGTWEGTVPVSDAVDDVLAHAGRELVEHPETPFTALHSAVALTAAGEGTRLRALRAHAAGATDPVLRDVVAPLCDGLLAVVEDRWADAVRLIRPLLARLTPVGGSLAQREIVEDTYLHALIAAGHCEEAVTLLDARLDRRPSTLDLRRRTAAAAPTA